MVANRVGATTTLVERLLEDDLSIWDESGAIHPRDPDLLLDAPGEYVKTGRLPPPSCCTGLKSYTFS